MKADRKGHIFCDIFLNQLLLRISCEITTGTLFERLSGENLQMITVDLAAGHTRLQM